MIKTSLLLKLITTCSLLSILLLLGLLLSDLRLLLLLFSLLYLLFLLCSLATIACQDTWLNLQIVCVCVFLFYYPLLNDCTYNYNVVHCWSVFYLLLAFHYIILSIFSFCIFFIFSYTLNTVFTSGASGVAIELFKTGGDKCLKSLTNIFNDILVNDKLPE